MATSPEHSGTPQDPSEPVLATPNLEENDQDTEERFETLYARYARPLEQALTRYVERHLYPPNVLNSIPDALQYAWIEASKRLDFLGDDPLPWLFTVARNELISILRRERLRPGLLSQHEAHVSLSHDVPDTREGANPTYRAIEQEWRDELEAILRQTGAGAEAAILAMLRGMTTPEVAEELNISPNTASQRVLRARLRLGETFIPSLRGREDHTPAKKKPSIPMPSAEARARPPQRERIELTQDQVGQIRSMTEHQIRELLNAPSLSKATISRLRNGLTFYHRHYHASEIAPNRRKARQYADEIHDAAEDAAHRAIRATVGDREVSDDIVEQIVQAAKDRLAELAGDPKFDVPNWRRGVAFNAARRAVRRLLPASD